MFVGTPRSSSIVASIFVLAACTGEGADGAGPCERPEVADLAGSDALISLQDEVREQSKCEVSGLISLQFTRLSDSETGRILEPAGVLGFAKFSKKPMIEAVSSPFLVSDFCAREPSATDPTRLTGKKNVGPEFEMKIGGNAYMTERFTDFIPDETVYFRFIDPNLLTPEDLARPGPNARLSLDGYQSELHMPESFAWNPDSWLELAETGVANLRWTPSGDTDNSDLRISAFFDIYDGEGNNERYSCGFVDDGHAEIDLQLAFDALNLPDGQLPNIFLSISRMSSNFVVHPEHGVLRATITEGAAFDVRNVPTGTSPAAP